jgi:hypothetical protein
LLAVAVNVHVGKLATGALNVDDALLIEMVAAVRPCYVSLALDWLRNIVIFFLVRGVLTIRPIAGAVKARSKTVAALSCGLNFFVEALDVTGDISSNCRPGQKAE